MTLFPRLSTSGTKAPNQKQTYEVLSSGGVPSFGVVPSSSGFPSSGGVPSCGVPSSSGFPSCGVPSSGGVPSDGVPSCGVPSYGVPSSGGVPSGGSPTGGNPTGSCLTITRKKRCVIWTVRQSEDFLKSCNVETWLSFRKLSNCSLSIQVHFALLTPDEYFWIWRITVSD